jgi:Uma2 family endonuclease
MGMSKPAYYTAEMVRALPADGNRYETVHGELLVTPAPRPFHQEVVRRLNFALSGYLDGENVGHLFASPADISWDDDILVQPDLFVVSLSEARTLDWSKMRTLSLAIEVLSPSTSRYDRFTKRRLYQEVGIPIYWIVDPERRLVEEWTPDLKFPQVRDVGVVWDPPQSSEPFSVDLIDLFRPI